MKFNNNSKAFIHVYMLPYTYSFSFCLFFFLKCLALIQTYTWVALVIYFISGIVYADIPGELQLPEQSWRLPKNFNRYKTNYQGINPSRPLKHTTVDKQQVPEGEIFLWLKLIFEHRLLKRWQFNNNLTFTSSLIVHKIFDIHVHRSSFEIKSF